MMGGGFLSDMAKYSAMDDAQRMIESLQVDIRRFKTELSDISINLPKESQFNPVISDLQKFFRSVIILHATKPGNRGNSPLFPGCF